MLFRSYPMWLDFWKGNEAKLKTLFKSEEALIKYYGGTTKEALIESYRMQYERAKTLGAKYMVFHVSHVLPSDSFTFKYDYTDQEVMASAIELINAAFPKEADGPLLLFENLWWPGLNYQDPALTKWFIEQIQYPNKGYLVDVSHLILMNPSIGTEEEAYRFIQERITALGEVKALIKGVHLNKTLPKFYRRRDPQALSDRYESEKDEARKLAILKKHISALDGHQPFDHPIAAKIIELIEPEFCVYETAPSTRYELAYFIKLQNKALGIQAL